MTSASEWVEKLREKASPLPWKAYRNHEGRMVVARYEGDDWVEFAEFFVEYIKRDADRGNAALAALAVNNVEMLVKALEKADAKLGGTGQDGTCGFHEDIPERRAALEALATVAEQAQKALKARP